jgi:hypothetical protein
MRGFRLGSPLGWFAAILFFFLPWVDISCQTAGGHEEAIGSLSGAQLAWGGRTLTNANGSSWSLFDADTFKDDPWRWIPAFLLSAYWLGLLASAWFICTRRPGTDRARMGVRLSVGLLGLLLGGCWAALGNPFPSEPAESLNPERGLEVHFTAWYLGSYLANLWTLAGFGLEYQRARRGSS